MLKDSYYANRIFKTKFSFTKSDLQNNFLKNVIISIKTQIYFNKTRYVVIMLNFFLKISDTFPTRNKKGKYS